MEHGNHQPQRVNGWLALLVALIELAVVVLAEHPELMDELTYRGRLWLAHLDTTNWRRLEWMRRYAAAGGYASDGIAPADTPQPRAAAV